jgi:hypothetical protein
MLLPLVGDLAHHTWPMTKVATWVYLSFHTACPAKTVNLPSLKLKYMCTYIYMYIYIYICMYVYIYYNSW